ncbi:hypothetical protein NLJ89_g8719 [Agrocybe chaxingu]|uniref:Ubiquitin-like protease family profile domain-containing protein n=1 Tax=Agrocybe chaxingu TaxID=84603 RepID=A0A9W8JS55_9AGAR|nr:hypothetical protein NLJ89_g8719 [Agrocybe chaxingu]
MNDVPELARKPTTPNLIAEEKADLLSRAAEGVRRIHCTEITSCDILPFLDDGQKLGATAIDAVASAYQQAAEKEGDTHWSVLSAWLGPIVDRKVVEGRHTRTTVEYMQQAVCAIRIIPPDVTDKGVLEANGQNMEVLLAKTLWIIPMCSSKEPKHWVVTWVDWREAKIGIFDSIPQLGSSSWAEPLLLRIIDHILAVLKRDPVEWDSGSWRRVLEHPESLQQQMDSWSCGLFVLMRIRAFKEGRGPEVARFDQRDAMRKEALAILLEIPIWHYPPRSNQPYDENSGDNEIVEVTTDMGLVLTLASLVEADVEDDEPLSLLEYGVDASVEDEGELQDGNRGKDNEGVKEGPGVSRSQIAGVSDPFPTRASKRPSPMPDGGDSDGYSTDREKKKKKSKSSSRPRRAYMNPEKRRLALQTDDSVLSGTVTESSVKCTGCRMVIKLSNKADKPYELSNWLKHKAKCSQLTGKTKIRTSAFQIEGGPVAYVQKTVNSTPSIARFFQPGPIMRSDSRASIIQEEILTMCRHLRGGKYQEYISLTHTRQFGGVSPTLIARITRTLFPYKTFGDADLNAKIGATTKKSVAEVLKAAANTAPAQVPPNGTKKAPARDWTAAERQRFQAVLQQCSRWEVDYTNMFIRSTRCEVNTKNANAICDACQALSQDKSLLHAIRKKIREAALSAEERQGILERRNKYAANNHLRLFETKQLQDKLSDPILFDIYESLKTGKPEDCFLLLHKQAQSGQLKDFGRFLDICEVLTDRVRRDFSGNEKLKYGIRYSRSYLDFMIAMRGYGQNSNRQYEILAAELCAPSVRHLRSLVTKSSDALQNPYLIFENVARVKRYVDSVKYTGPILVGSDCTKVRKRLNFSTQHGSHILGTTLDLAEVEVDSVEDIDEIVERTVRQKAHATQVRAILARIPLPNCPPLVIALLPNSGKENADDIHGHHLKLQAMASQLKLPLIAFAADGAAVELAAQYQMDHTQSNEPALTYDYPLYGIHLEVPVFANTGPLISITDPAHAVKTSRNQPQYGTHTASLGVGHLVNQSLVDLYLIDGSGLVIRDVENVDKQDDGAARRIFHVNTLNAAVTKEEGKIRDGFEGVFVYLFIMGTLFEAWMNPAMSIDNRVLAALRARFWLHYWHVHILFLSSRLPDLYSPARSFISSASFQIFNRLCDTLILLVLAYSRFYPTIPFCVWVFGTSFVEHFFGIARQLLPNFSYAEFLKMVQHIMVRQRILESGVLKSKRERDSAGGYIFSAHTDMRKRDSSAEGFAPASLSEERLNQLVRIAHDEAFHICWDILLLTSIPRLEVAKRVDLLPLGAPAPRVKKNKNKDLPDDTEDVSDTDLEDEDSDPEDACDDRPDSATGLSSQDQTIDGVASQASSMTAEYSALCTDLDDIIEDAALTPSGIALPTPHELPKLHPNIPSLLSQALPKASQLIDHPSGKVSVEKMVKYRQQVQSGTVVKSERTVTVSPKYALAKVREADSDSAGGDKLSTKEVAHRLRITQDLNADLKKQETKKTRQLRWETIAKGIQEVLRSSAILTKSISPNVSNSRSELPNISSKNVTLLHILQRGSFVIMQSPKHFYIGEVLDIYKRGTSGRYGSVTTASSIQGLAWLSLRVYLPLAMTINPNGENAEDDDNDDDEVGQPTPDFICTIGNHKFHLHTHAAIGQLIYHLGKGALTGDKPLRKSLVSWVAGHWHAVQRARAVIPPAPSPLKIRIPGGKMK